MNPHGFKPIATRRDDGRVAVYIASGYQFLPHEAALSLFTQLAVALGIPYSDGVARYAAQMLAAARTDGGCDVDGAAAQDYAQDNELLEPFECPAGGCGDDCLCSEGDRCLRLSPMGRELMRLIDADPEPVREVGA